MFGINKLKKQIEDLQIIVFELKNPPLFKIGDVFTSYKHDGNLSNKKCLIISKYTVRDYTYYNFQRNYEILFINENVKTEISENVLKKFKKHKK